MTDDDMCPNCVTPWKCNGPHGEADPIADTIYGFLVSEGYHGHYPSAEEQAEKLAAQLAPTIAAHQAKVLREAADEIEGELVCCDVFERRDVKSRHHICYWGGAAAKLVSDRAAAIDPASK